MPSLLAQISSRRTHEFLRGNEEMNHDAFMMLLRDRHERVQPQEKQSPEEECAEACAEMLEGMIDGAVGRVDKEGPMRMAALKLAFAKEKERFCREALFDCLMRKIPLDDRDWPFIVRSCLKDSNPNLFRIAAAHLESYADDVGEGIVRGRIRLFVDSDSPRNEGSVLPVLSEASMIFIDDGEDSKEGEREGGSDRTPLQLSQTLDLESLHAPDASVDQLEPLSPSRENALGKTVLFAPPQRPREWSLEDAAIQRASRVTLQDKTWDLLPCFANQVKHPSLCRNGRLPSMPPVPRWNEKSAGYECMLTRSCHGRCCLRAPR